LPIVYVNIKGGLLRMGQPSIQSIIAILQEGNQRDRAFAVDTLGDRGDSQGVHPLIQVLDEGTVVSERAMLALAKLGPLALDSLIASFQKGNSFQRMKLFRIISKIQDSRTMEFLLQLLQHGDPYFRMSAAQALGILGDQSVIPCLNKSLTDPDVSVRYAAAGALDSLGWTPQDKDVQSNYEFAKGFLDRKSPEIPEEPKPKEPAPEEPVEKVEEKKELIYFGSFLPATAKPVSPSPNREEIVPRKRSSSSPQIMEVYREATRDSKAKRVSNLELVIRNRSLDVHTRDVYIGQLAALREPRTSSVFIEVLSDPDPLIRTTALRALHKLARPTIDPAATSLIISLLKDMDKRVFTAAAAVLIYTADIEDADALVAELSSAFNSPMMVVRRAVVRRISKIHHPKAIALLLEALSDPKSRVQDAAIEGLSIQKYLDLSQFNRILERVQDPREKFNAGAARILAALRYDPVDNSLLDRLISIFRSGSTAARMGIVSFLWHNVDLSTVAHPAIEEIIGASFQSDAYSVKSADFITWLFREDSLTSPLAFFLRCLKNDAPSVRTGAAFALGELGGDAAVQALIGTLSDEDPMVVEEAKIALTRLGHPEFDTASFERNHSSPGGIPSGRLLPHVEKRLKYPSDKPEKAGSFTPVKKARQFSSESAKNKWISRVSRILKESPNRDARVSAVNQLALLNDSRAVTLLFDALRDPEWLVRWTAVRMLALVEDSSSIPLLIKCLKDPDSLVRQTTA
jgi:HEAT repeat protein